MNKFIIGLILGIAIAGGLAYYLNNMPNQFVNKVTNNASDKIPQSSAPLILAPGTKIQEFNASAPTSSKNSDDLERERNNQNNANTVNDNQNKDIAASTPSYDFYDILQGKKATDNNKSTSKVTITQFIIQAGAFNDQNLANDMKARLALMGVNATIKAQQNGDRIINRVIIGPFTKEDDAKKVMIKLNSDNIQGTLIKIGN